MKLLLDTNVVLDVLVARQPFFVGARDIFSRIERGEHAGFLCATTVTTIHYLVAKSVGRKAADDAVAVLMSLFRVLPVTHAVLDSALKAGFDDFEDAVLHETARHASLDGIVTRDATGFRTASVAVYQPDELIRIWESAERR